MNPEKLKLLVTREMPFGKYKGRLIADLPATCQRVIELRRIQGLSQRETARILGVTENVVENHSKRGLRMILNALAGLGPDGSSDAPVTNAEIDVRTRSGTRN